MRRLIPPIIHESEYIVRAVFDPFSYSVNKKKVREIAFLPKPDETDVSVLRKKYASADTCKSNSMSIAIPGYCGLAVFRAKDINDINATAVPLKPEIVHSPMTVTNAYRPLSQKVYRNTTGTPMHADIKYPVPIAKGQPTNNAVKFARQLANISNFVADPNPTVPGIWRGERILPHP